MLGWLAAAAWASPTLSLGPAPLPGDTLIAEVGGLVPGETAFLVGSTTGEGETCAPAGCVALAAPLIVLDRVVGGPEGSATSYLRVPEAVPGGTRLWLQAVSPAPFDASPVAAVTILAPPEPTARLTPVRPWPDEALHCATTDATRVRWSVDDTPWAGATETQVVPGDRIPAGVAEVGQRWECTAEGPGGEARSAAAVTLPLGGNVLVLLADDLGVERLGLYGGIDPIPTPTLDSLAAEGVRFEHATVHATCSPTRAALLTGRHSRRTGVGVRIGTISDDWELPLDELLVPEILAESSLGYTSVALGKWHLAANASPSSWSHPLLQGFSRHLGSFGNLQLGHEIPDEPLDYYHWAKLVDGVPTYSDTYATTDTVDDALAQIGSLAEPWYLHVAFNAPHDPFHFPPLRLFDTPIGLDATDAEKWAAAVEALDTEIGRLLDGMDPAVRARTTVVFLGDNGWPEEAVTPPFDPARAKTSLFEGGVRVPLIVSGPGVTSPGSSSEALVADVDLLPTIAELAGVRLPNAAGSPLDTPWPDLELDGESWVPLLAEPLASSERTTVFLERFSPNGAAADWDMDETGIRDERFKLLRYTSGSEELYDLWAAPLIDGPDLLTAPLDEEAEAAHARLSDALDAARSALGAD